MLDKEESTIVEPKVEEQQVQRYLPLEQLEVQPSFKTEEVETE